MQTRYRLRALFAVTVFSLAGCESDIQQTQRIERVAEPQQITFLSPHGNTPSGYTLHVHGHIDGVASITPGDSKAHPISGDVDWSIYQDFFRPTIAVVYTPAKVEAGHLVVELTFH